MKTARDLFGSLIFALLASAIALLICLLTDK
jgi:hypothetical protein